MATGYKYNFRKVLQSIATEVAVSTEPVNTYLSCLPKNYSNFSIHSVVYSHFLGSYSNDYITINNNNNRIRQYYLELEKYWVT